MFDFVAAIAVSCLGFLFPSVFFLTAAKRYMKPEDAGNFKFERYMSYLNAVLGVIVFMLGVFSNVVTIIQDKTE